MATVPSLETRVGKEFARLPLHALLAIAAVVLPVVAASASAYVFSSAQQPVYGAQFEVLVADSDANEDPTTLMETQRVLLTSRTVLAPVARRTGMSVERLQEAVSTSVPPNTRVLRVTVTDEDPETARGAATAIAASYVRTARAQATATHARARRVLDLRIADLTARLRVVRARLSGVPSGVALTARQQQLATEADVLTERIGNLLDQRTAIQVEQTLRPQTRIITYAHALEGPLEPKPLRAAAAGAFVGIVITLAAAAVFWRTASR